MVDVTQRIENSQPEWRPSFTELLSIPFLYRWVTCSSLFKYMQSNNIQVDNWNYYWKPEKNSILIMWTEKYRIYRLLEKRFTFTTSGAELLWIMMKITELSRIMGDFMRTTGAETSRTNESCPKKFLSTISKLYQSHRGCDNEVRDRRNFKSQLSVQRFLRDLSDCWDYFLFGHLFEGFPVNGFSSKVKLCQWKCANNCYAYD